MDTGELKIDYKNPIEAAEHMADHVLGLLRSGDPDAVGKAWRIWRTLPQGDKDPTVQTKLSEIRDRYAEEIAKTNASFFSSKPIPSPAYRAQPPELSTRAEIPALIEGRFRDFLVAMKEVIKNKKGPVTVKEVYTSMQQPINQGHSSHIIQRLLREGLIELAEVQKKIGVSGRVPQYFLITLKGTASLKISRLEAEGE